MGNSIDHDAVIRALARHPDGVDLCSSAAQRQLADDAGLAPEDLDSFNRLLDVVLPALRAEGRTRETSAGDTAISHTEQARRIMALLELDKRPSAPLMELGIAGVLAGKVQPGAV